MAASTNGCISKVGSENLGVIKARTLTVALSNETSLAALI
jgi:hypothetical protein